MLGWIAILCNITSVLGLVWLLLTRKQLETYTWYWVIIFLNLLTVLGVVFMHLALSYLLK
jgi:hypothetical protein